MIYFLLWMPIYQNLNNFSVKDFLCFKSFRAPSVWKFWFCHNFKKKMLWSTISLLVRGIIFHENELSGECEWKSQKTFTKIIFWVLHRMISNLNMLLLNIFSILRWSVVFDFQNLRTFFEGPKNPFFGNQNKYEKRKK